MVSIHKVPVIVYLIIRVISSTFRFKRGNTHAGRGYIPNRIDIEERPSIVDLKQRFGDWEIDTIIGSNHKGVLVTINVSLLPRSGFANFRGKMPPR